MDKSKKTIEAERRAIKAIVGNVNHKLIHRQHKRFGDVWGEGTWTLTFPNPGEDIGDEKFERLVEYMDNKKLKWEYITTDTNGRRWIA